MAVGLIPVVQATVAAMGIVRLITGILPINCVMAKGTSKKIATLDIKEVRKIPNLTMSDFYIISDLWELVKKNNNKTAQLFIEFLSGYKEKGNDSK